MGNFVIATAILWGLDILCLTPLGRYFLHRKLRQPAYANLATNGPLQGTDPVLGRLVGQAYILADILVLSAAGAIAGLLGYWFIGVTLKARAWPGMLAFIVSS